MEYYSTQVAKIVTRNKEGSKLMAFEHSFDKFFQDDYAKTGKTLEPSGLERYIIKVNDKKNTGTVSFRANLPCQELDRLYKLSAVLMENETFARETKDVCFYSPPVKYHRGFDNDKGYSLCYSLKISYQAAMKAKIKIEVKNFYAPVKKMPDQTTQIQMSNIVDEKNVAMYITTNEWFDTISHLYKTWNSYSISAFEKKLQRSFLPVTNK